MVSLKIFFAKNLLDFWKKILNACKNLPIISTGNSQISHKFPESVWKNGKILGQIAHGFLEEPRMKFLEEFSEDFLQESFEKFLEESLFILGGLYKKIFLL